MSYLNAFTNAMRLAVRPVNQWMLIIIWIKFSEMEFELNVTRMGPYGIMNLPKNDIRNFLRAIKRLKRNFR